MKGLKILLIAGAAFTAGYLVSEQITIDKYCKDVKPKDIIIKEEVHENCIDNIKNWWKETKNKIPFFKKNYVQV